jgi:large repetitive protein
VALALTQGITVSGRVLDTQGNPVGGADVRGRGEHWQDQQTSDTRGQFVLANLSPGNAVTLSAATGPRWSGLHGPITVPEGGLRGVELVLSEARDALVAGVVVDAEGHPLVAGVAGWPIGGTIVALPPMDTSDTEGRFVWTQVPPGEYTVTVRPGQGEQLEVDRISLDAGEQLRDLRLVYPDVPKMAIGGRVVGPDGAGVEASLVIARVVPGADAPAQVGHGNSMPNGSFQFENLLAGTYALNVRAAGFVTGRFRDIIAGSEDLEVVLEPALRIEGYVVDAAGNPVTDYEISLENTAYLVRYDRRLGTFRQISHPEGYFESDLEEGEYEALVLVEGREPYVFPIGFVSAAKPPDILRIQLP